MFDEPKLWQVILWPTALTVGGFAISRNFGWDKDTAIAQCGLTVGAVWVGIFICLKAYEAALREQYDTEIKVIQPKQIQNLNAVYNETVEQVSMDAEKYVAHTLINMQHDHKVDLTEKYWITGKRFDGSREQFALMLREWEQVGAVRRKSRAKNSPYVVADWNKIRKIVRG